MAVDAVLFDRAIGYDRQPIVRIYTWSDRTVTIGRLQDFAEARRIYSNDLLVRRPTGGKAVLHTDDLTISVVVPDAFLTARLARRGVLASHSVILAGVAGALRQCGFEAVTGNDSVTRNTPADCFARSGRCDLTDARTGCKLLGSAQARKSGIVLQQMSLRSIDRLDIHGDDFVDALREIMGRTLGVASWCIDEIDATEALEATEAARQWETF